MEIQDTHQFLARGSLKNGDDIIPVVFNCAYPKWSSAPPRCKVFLEGGGSILRGKGGCFEIEGITEEGREVWIPCFTVTQHKESVEPNLHLLLEGEAEFYIEGDLQELDASQGRFSCQVFVPCTALVASKSIEELHFNGTVNREDQETREISWLTDAPTTEWKLSEVYEYTNGKVGVSEALIRVRRCQAHFLGTFKVGSLKAFAEKLDSILDEPLMLLSFLSHQRMHWYEARIVFFSPNHVRTAIVRRRQWLGYDVRNAHLGLLHLLVDPDLLAQGMFHTMYQNYLSLPEKNVLRNIMSYVIVSYEDGYFETRLAMLYTALESLVNVLGEDRTIGSARFKKLRRHLEKVIKEQVPDSNLAESIIKKLPELKRRAFAERLWLLFEKYNLNVSMLWPLEVNVRGEVQAIVRRRNNFIHKGRIDDQLSEYHRDFIRLQKLLELWILQMIGYPLQKVNRLAFQELLLSYP